MEKLNVLHVIDHMGIGGAQRIVSELLNKHKKENINLFCYALRVSSNEFEYKNKRVFFTSNNKSKYNILSFFELKKFIEKENIKILHLHLAKSIMFGVLLKMFYCKDIKIIAHEHGKIFQNNLLYNYFLSVFQNEIDLFIAVSDETKRLLINKAKIKNNKIKLLFNFVNLDKFNIVNINNLNNIEERKKFGLDSANFIIGFAGRLNKIKACDLLIKSIRYTNIPNFKLLIAGDGPEKRDLENLVKVMKIEDKIVFCGYCRDILKFYNLIDGFVFSSISEASPMAFFEVQALGIPIIANDVESLNELIENGMNGLIFKKNDEKDLGEKIMLLYKDKTLRRKLSENSLENIKKYSIDNYHEKLELIYDSLINCNA